MTAVRALRRLSHRRATLAGLALLGLLVVVVVTLRVPQLTPRQHDIGVGTASALIDSSRSQVADLGNTGSDIGSLAARASLLSSLAASAPIKDDIARRAGVATQDLIASSPNTDANTPVAAETAARSAVAASSPKAVFLDVSVPTVQAGQLPIIEATTRAPTAAFARRLADATFASLQADISSIARSEGVPELQRVVIRQLGAAVATTQASGPGLPLGLLGGLAAFLLGCFAVIGFERLGQAWRRTAEIEAAETGGSAAAVAASRRAHLSPATGDREPTQTQPSRGSLRPGLGDAGGAPAYGETELGIRAATTSGEG